MKKEVLLVEDEVVFRFINEQIIRLTGLQCDVVGVSNGEEALRLINTCLDAKFPTPDFIFIDLNIPLMDGVQFIELMQSIKFHNRPKPGIIILTSLLDEHDRLRAKKHFGIDYYVTRPLNESDVIRIFDL